MRLTKYCYLCCLCLLVGAVPSGCTTKPRGAVRFLQAPIPLGEEYTGHSKGGSTNELPSSANGRSWTRAILWYLPNRLFDALDIFRADVGVGPSFGGVVRVTKWGQIGYREFSPLSVRVGLHGRALPIFVERTNEFGAGPLFASSPQRSDTTFEFGAGIDILLAGLYVGVVGEELADFLLGIAGIDISGDDWR
ncbi:MAG: hypothetical protein KDD69_09470 [Bdellovibrionales bacterium]|nr:hypothetical protein [Bdellovibrionales bacterium]